MRKLRITEVKDSSKVTWTLTALFTSIFTPSPLQFILQTPVRTFYIPKSDCVGNLLKNLQLLRTALEQNLHPSPDHPAWLAPWPTPPVSLQPGYCLTFLGCTQLASTPGPLPWVFLLLRLLCVAGCFSCRSQLTSPPAGVCPWPPT